MGDYVARKDFVSVQLGNVMQGQRLTLDDGRAGKWIEAGLVEAPLEVKPAPSAADIEVKPAPAKGRVNVKRRKSTDG